MKMTTTISLPLAVALFVSLAEGTALAQRGGGRAGGARPGPAANAGARPSFNRTPSFNAPAAGARPQMPAAGARPARAGPGRPSQSRAGPGESAEPAPGQVGRPNPAPGQVGRPNPAPGQVNRPNPRAGAGDRPNPAAGPGESAAVDRRSRGEHAQLRKPAQSRQRQPAQYRQQPPSTGPILGNTTVNRPNIGNNSGNTTINRPGPVNSGNNITVNKINNINNTRNVNVSRNVNNMNLNRPSWASGNPNWAYRPGNAYHQGWVNGYWHGQNNGNWWNNGGAFMTGMAVGGIGAWGVGSAVYGWGYRPYVNPYYAMAPVVVQQPVVVTQPTTVVVQQPVPLQQSAVAAGAAPVDYSQPLSTGAPPPDPAVADPAHPGLRRGPRRLPCRQLHRRLQKTDASLKTLPNDAAMNEFRALCLFALQQYDQAAATLYAVLSAGPGWDWTTMSSLYPNIDVYTTQVRALEAYSSTNPQSASARFVLAYHYLTQGHTEAAVDELKAVVKLQPADQLSAQLVTQLSGTQATPPAEASATTVAAPPAEAAPAAATQGNLVGVWKASPAQGTSIELTLGGDSKFNWNVVSQGKTQPIAGTYTYENGVLSLTQSENNAMVGKVAWKDEGHFNFQAMGGGPNDPGLTFSK